MASERTSTAITDIDIVDDLRQHPVTIAQEAANEIEALRDLLTDIYLYVDWRYVTKQQTTEQKELFASVVEAAGMTADRWWVDSGSTQP